MIEQRLAFIKEYEQLVLKHRMFIDWCGCCSLWLTNLQEDDDSSIAMSGIDQSYLIDER